MYRTLKRNRALSLLMALVMASSSDQHAYELIGPKWPSSPVMYYVNTSNADLDPTLVVPAVQQGALAWSEQSYADFAFQYAGSSTATVQTYNQKNEMIFRNASSGNAIATAYTWYSGDTILDSDIVFWDAAFQFFVGNSGCSGGYYIEDIATHEFGHSAGIDHTLVSGATMYPSVSYCSTGPRSLASDDLDAIEALYPPSSVPTAPMAPSSLTAVQGGDPYTSIDLDWQDNSEDETAFLVERSTDGATFSQVDALPANTTAYPDTNLENGTTYHYRVMATNSGGSSQSNMAMTATDTPAPPSQPDAPLNPSPTNADPAVDRNADLSWSPSAGAQTYDVHFGTESPPPVYRTGLTSPNIRLRKLSAGTTYYWMVFAVGQGVSSDSTLWSFQTAGGSGGGSSPGGGGGGGGNGGGKGKKK